MITDRAYRRRGFAGALLEFALAKAWERNCFQVLLMTGNKTEAAARLYERAGFCRGVKTGYVAFPRAK